MPGRDYGRLGGLAFHARLMMGHAIEVHLNGDGCWPDLREIVCEHGEVMEAAYLERGTLQGSPSVTLRIRLDDGRIVLAETTLKLFLTVAAAFRGKAQRDGLDIG